MHFHCWNQRLDFDRPYANEGCKGGPYHTTAYMQMRAARVDRTTRLPICKWGVQEWAVPAQTCCCPCCTLACLPPASSVPWAPSRTDSCTTESYQCRRKHELRHVVPPIGYHTGILCIIAINDNCWHFWFLLFYAFGLTFELSFWVLICGCFF